MSLHKEGEFMQANKMPHELPTMKLLQTFKARESGIHMQSKVSLPACRRQDSVPSGAMLQGSTKESRTTLSDTGPGQHRPGAGEQSSHYIFTSLWRCKSYTTSTGVAHRRHEYCRQDEV